MNTRARTSSSLFGRAVAPAALALFALLPACSAPYAATRVAAAGSYRVEILIDGHPTSVYRHRSRYFVAGSEGKRYEIRIRNESPRRVEAVVSVDGRDVIDGRPASVGRRGYLIDAYGTATIDGFRTSASEVAAFRFSPVSASYAARMGNDANVGVIGVAIFPERQAPPPIAVRRYWDPYVEDEARGGGGYGAGRSAQAETSQPTGATPPPSAKAGADRALGAAEEQRAASSPVRRERRPGLGTAFGERRTSIVEEVPFEREDADHPAATITVHYDDWDGLLAAGVVPRPDPRVLEQQRRAKANPFPVDDRYALPPP
ncbi:MAG: hypothetical protein FJ125_17415 [Deltaproteobacteria bacterium]|nr:hypothetical protein [Deltaproteobacteria bacterium]